MTPTLAAEILSRMSRLTQTRWFLPLCVLVSTVGGLALTTSDKESSRLFGLGTLLFFGVGGGAVLIGRLLGHAPTATVGTVALPGGERQEGLILPFLAMPVLLRILGGLGLIAGCAVFAFSEATSSATLRLIAGLAGAVFAISIALTLRPGGARPGSLSLTRWGAIVEAGTQRTCVPWTAVDRAHRVDYRGQPMLMLTLRDPGAVVRTGGAQALNLVGTFFYGANVVPIGLRLIDLPPDRTAGIVERFLEASRAAVEDPRSAWPPIRQFVDGLLPARGEARPEIA